MTISTTDSNQVFIGDGVVTVFAVTYSIISESDIEVYLDGGFQGSGYTVTLNPDQETAPGADITFDVAPAVDVVVNILRVVDLTQETDYQPYDAFPAETHEQALDRLTMQTQQLQEQFDRINLPPPGLPDTGVFPVGSIMFGFNPNGLLSGTWTQLPGEGTFIMNTLAGADPSGGSNDAVVVAHQHASAGDHGHASAGAHTHSYTRYGNLGTREAGGSGVTWWQNTITPATSSNGAHTHANAGAHQHPSAGVDGVGKNRPVYKGVPIWERTE